MSSIYRLGSELGIPFLGKKELVEVKYGESNLFQQACQVKIHLLSERETEMKDY